MLKVNRVLLTMNRIASYSILIFALAFSVQPQLSAQQIVPAGTILQCTLTDSNLSSKTVAVEDPVLCDMGPIRQFGVSVFPHGASLGGRLSEYRDPGHLWGKGWMQLDFDRIVLPGAEVPISTKVVSAPRLKVDAQGKIHGKGHARRDAVEWAIPVLWPEKILTLPMRGPRPTLKGESRITLKLMQDLPVPEQAATVAQPRLQLMPSAYPALQEKMEKPGGRRTFSSPSEASYHLVSAVAHSSPASAVSESLQDAESGTLTFLVLKDGRGRVVTDYWFEDAQRIRYVTANGSSGQMPIESLDLGTTVKLNRERGVPFVVQTKDAEN